VFAEAFLSCIRDSGAGPEYEGGIDYLYKGNYAKLSEEDRLRELLQDSMAVSRGPWLTVCDYNANYGGFPDLEAFCKGHNLSYDLHHDSGGSYDAGIEYYRQGARPLCVLSSNNDQVPLVAAKPVIKARDALYRGNFHAAITLLDGVLGSLWGLPELPPFRIVP